MRQKILQRKFKYKKYILIKLIRNITTLNEITRKPQPMNFIKSFNNILNVYHISHLRDLVRKLNKLSWIRFISGTNKAIRGKTLCNLIRSTNGNLPAAPPSNLHRFIAQSTKKLTRWTCRGFSCTWTRMTHVIYEWGKLLFRKLTQPSSPSSIDPVSLKVRDPQHDSWRHSVTRFISRSSIRPPNAPYRVNETFLSLSKKKKKKTDGKTREFLRNVRII